MKKNDKYYCSFCGKIQDEVSMIFDGPDNHDICDECVDSCVSIMYEKGYTLPFVDRQLGREMDNLIEEIELRLKTRNP